MPPFSYKAYGPDGRDHHAMIDALSLSHAEDAIYAAGLTPFELRAASGSGSGSAKGSNLSMRGGIRLPPKALSAFTFELATLSKAGLPLDEALRIIAGPGAKPKTALLARALLKDVLSGAQLSEAMAKHPRSFSPEYRAILAAGERGGAIARVLGDLAKLLSGRLAVRGKIAAALVYPCILVVMSIVSIGVIVSVLVPSLMPIFEDANVPLPGILGTMKRLQDGAAGELSSIGIVALVLFAAWKAVGRDPKLLQAVDRAKAGLPLLGKMLRMHVAARFARGLGTLVGAGVPMMSALRIAQDLVANRHLARLYEDAIARVPEGEALHQAFEDTALIPAATLRLIAVGEETGRLAEMLSEAAAILEGEMQQLIERALSLLTPLMTVCIGGGVGALIMSVMSAVLSINDLAFR